MKKAFSSRTSRFALLLAVLFFLSLIPILATSFYAHPLRDDFVFSLPVRQALENGGGFWGVLKGAMESAESGFYSWQGTFIAIMVFSLQPGVFSDNLYFLTTFIMLGALIGSTFFFLHTVLIRWLKQPKSHLLIIGFLALFVQIQFIPNIDQAFFWYNGASYYTLFYAVSLFLMSFVVRLLLANHTRQRILLCIPASVLAFLIGGSNYSSALFVACVLAFTFLFLLWQKQPAAPYMLVIFCFLLGAFLPSVMAPGNAYRAALVDQMNPVEAIIASIVHGLIQASKWTNIDKFIVLILCTPLLFKAAEECSWSFRYPLLAIIIAYGFYACLMTPTLYAMSYTGEGRQVNLYYYTYVMMLLFDVFYLSGWIAKQHPELTSSRRLFAFARSYALPVLLSLVLMFGCYCANLGPEKITSAACALVLQDGSAKEYHEVVTAQFAQMYATDGECILTTEVPKVLVFGDPELYNDPTHWVNAAYANTFHCERVIYEPVK